MPMFQALIRGLRNQEGAHTSIIDARSLSRRSTRDSVSGSPNRTLYSSTLGPDSVSMNPVKRSPTNGNPRRTCVKEGMNGQ